MKVRHFPEFFMGTEDIFPTVNSIKISNVLAEKIGGKINILPESGHQKRGQSLDIVDVWSACSKEKQLKVSIISSFET